MMLHQPDWRARLREELTEWRPWATRAVVLVFAAAAGLTVAGFTWLSEHAYALFERGAAAVVVGAAAVDAGADGADRLAHAALVCTVPPARASRR